MGRKIFISYKYKDTNVRQMYHIWYSQKRNTRVRDYVDKLQELIGEDNINKGEKDGEDMSVLEDATIQSVLGDKIYDSSITLVLTARNGPVDSLGNFLFFKRAIKRRKNK